MVRLLSSFVFFLLALLGTLSWSAENEPVFKMEFSKKEVYVGEQVMCNFVVYSPDTVVEVEVAKFPEFRGFWKENLVLRQGPIPTSPGLHGQLNQAVVGTYVLTPMQGEQDPLIEPMKVVIRNPNSHLIEGSTPPDFTYSDGPPPKIKPLPKLPAGEDPKAFTGAVGRFSFYPGDNHVPFQKEDPAQFRITLTGQGNFQDINALPLPFPATMQELSRQSFQQGTTQVNAKSFEYTVQIQGDRTFSLPAAPFIYFDPDAGNYQKIYTPPIEFTFLKTEAPTPAEEETPARLSPLETSVSVYHPLSQSLPFWMVQIVIFLGLTFFSLKRLLRLRRLDLSKRPSFQRRQRLIQARELFQSGRLEAFLKEADSLARDCLSARIKIAPGLPKSELLKQASGRIEPSLITAAQNIFSAYEQLAFRPDHQAINNAEGIVKSLEKLVG